MCSLPVIFKIIFYKQVKIQNNLIGCLFLFSQTNEIFACRYDITKGCPTSGYYGINCSIPCPEHCLTHCHIEKGTCQACKPGYQGQRCEQGDIFFYEKLQSLLGLSD